jgi:nucleotide-binding universal stress UspA family protein
MIGTIVVGYDGSAVGERVLARSAEIAAAFGSAIVVVVVVVEEVPRPGSAALGMADALPLLPTDPIDHETAREAWIERARNALEDLGATCEVVSRRGIAEHAILDVAADRNADLIVVGTNEPGFFERLVAGSVSGAVARSASCDVLVVHDRQTGTA